MDAERWTPDRPAEGGHRRGIRLLQLRRLGRVVLERGPAGQCAALRRTVALALPQLLGGPDHGAVRPAGTGHARRADVRGALRVRLVTAARAGPGAAAERDVL